MINTKKSKKAEILIGIETETNKRYPIMLNGKRAIRNHVKINATGLDYKLVITSQIENYSGARGWGRCAEDIGQKMKEAKVSKYIIENGVYIAQNNDRKSCGQVPNQSLAIFKRSLDDVLR